MGVPVSYMAEAVDQYVRHGIRPGAFLCALFSNDLKGAFRCADEDNTAAMREWVRFMVNEMPLAAQGDPETVENWIRFHQVARNKAAAETAR